MIGTTPRVIKVPKGAGLIRVNIKDIFASNLLPAVLYVVCLLFMPENLEMEFIGFCIPGIPNI